MITRTTLSNVTRSAKRFVVALATVALCASAAYADDNTFHFGYCSNDLVGIGVGQDRIYYAAAIEITPEQATKFAGCQITGVSVGFGTGVKKDVEIFVTHDLKGTPEVSASRKVSVNKFNNLLFDTPYTITAGQKFFVGYTYYNTSSVSYPVAFDGRTTNYDRRGDYISFAIDKDGLASQWTHVGHNYGNACIRAIMTGDNLPTANALPRKITGPTIVAVGEPNDFTLTLSNQSIAPIESVELTLTEGETVTTQQVTLAEPVQPNADGTLVFSYAFTGSSDDNVLEVSISKVNGKDNDSAADKALYQVSANVNVFPRVNVVEEFTGTTCANCPRGIVGMEYMEKTYGQTNWIGIAVHNYSGDPMRCHNYEQWISGVGISGAPQSSFNRNRELGPIDPSKDVLERAHREGSPISNMKVRVEVSNINKEAKTADIKAYITPGANGNGGSYSIAYVVTEDEVGPYEQSNNYGPVLPPLEGYPTSGRVSQMYNHVARYINVWNGAIGLLPSSIEAGVEYSDTHKAVFPAVGNVDNASYIVLLFDRYTGEIVNADKYSPKHGGLNPAAVESVADAINNNVTINGRTAEYFGQGVATVYSLSGNVAARLANGQSAELVAGMYIVSMPGKTLKVVVK